MTTRFFIVVGKQIRQLLLNGKSVLFVAFFSTLLCVSCDEKIPDKPQPIVNRFTENITFFSQTLNRDVTFALYLPADYTTSQARYGTVYLLHGWGDNQTAWIKGGKVHTIINDLETKGTIDPYIYVMPNALKSYYVNYANGKFDYMDMLVNELVPYVDSLYRTKSDANHRAVVGYSMGGYGAVILPYKHPETFNISVSLSMSWRTHEQYCSEPQSIWDSQFGRIFGGEGVSGEARLTDYYLQHDPLTFFEDLSEAQKRVNLWMDCGDDEEQLSVTALELHALLQKKEVSHHMRLRNGAHTWDYWHGGMREALPFITKTMNGLAEPDITEATRFATNLSGSNQTVDMNGCTLHITTPKDYSAKTDSCHVIYLAYASYENRTAELQRIGLLLDSLQVDKNFILIAFDVEQFSHQSVDFSTIVDFMNGHYRTKQKAYHRLIIGNATSGNWLYETSVINPSLTQAVYFLNTNLEILLEPSTNAFYYLAAGDKSTTGTHLSDLYLKCRQKNCNHEYRLLNGNDSFETFLYLLQESIPYIGLKLNKF